MFTSRSEKLISMIDIIPAPPNDVRWLHLQDVTLTVESSCAWHPLEAHVCVSVLKYSQLEKYTPTESSTS